MLCIIYKTNESAGVWKVLRLDLNFLLKDVLCIIFKTNESAGVWKIHLKTNMQRNSQKWFQCVHDFFEILLHQAKYILEFYMASSI